MKKIITCKNCNNQFEGNFCNNCRQSANTDRIGWHDVIHALPHALFHADKGLFYTLKEMTIRPGHTIREYINGKRIYHFNPLLYTVLLGGFAIFLFATAHVKLINKAIDLEAIESYNSLIAHKFLMIPALSMMILFAITDFFLYREKKYLMPELIISNVFQMGQVVALLIIIFPLLYIQQVIEINFGWHVAIRPFIKGVIVIYLFYVRYQLYEASGNYRLIIKIALQVIGVYCLYNFLIEPLITYVFS